MEIVHPVHQLQYHGAKIPNIDCWPPGRADDYLGNKKASVYQDNFNRRLKGKEVALSYNKRLVIFSHVISGDELFN
jgi:hypothetical protein